jgi:hypothetical protein
LDLPLLPSTLSQKYKLIPIEVKNKRRVLLGEESLVRQWSPLQQELEAPHNIATSRNCLLARPRSHVREEALSTAGGSRRMPRRGIADPC